MFRPSLLAIAFTVQLIGVAPGQPQPGDLILADITSWQQEIKVLNRRTGIFTTLSPQTIEYPNCVTMAKDNVDLLVPLASRWLQNTWLAQLTPLGGYASLYLGNSNCPTCVALHETGADYVVGMQLDNELWRVDMTTRSTVTSCSIGSMASVYSLARDPDTGDWIVGGVGLTWVHEPTGAKNRIGTLAGPFSSVDFEPRTGNLVCAQTGTPSIVVLDRHTGKSLKGFNTGRTFAVKVDDFTGHYYAAGNGTVIEYTPTGTPVNTWTLAGSVWSSVEVYGSRQISGLGVARPGTRFPIDFSFRGMGNAYYVGTLALSQRPGIPIRNGVINLTPDVLFWASLSGAFVTGFSGILDSAGNATGHIAIPAFLPQGFTFYCAGIAYRGNAIQVSNTIGITIR